MRESLDSLVRTPVRGCAGAGGDPARPTVTSNSTRSGRPGSRPAPGRGNNPLVPGTGRGRTRRLEDSTPIPFPAGCE